MGELPTDPADPAGRATAPRLSWPSSCSSSPNVWPLCWPSGRESKTSRCLLLVDQMEEAVTMAADRDVRDRFSTRSVAPRTTGTSRCG